MQVATATQPSSRHHKHYVPIVAGTLGGCGLLLFLGCLAYLFIRSRRHKYAHRARVTTIQPRDCTNKGDRDGPIVARYEDRTALPSYKPAILPSSASSVWSARAKDYSEDFSFAFAVPPSRKKRRIRTAGRCDEPLWDTISTTGSTSINDTGPHQVISNSLPAISAWSEGAEDCVFDLLRSVSPGETPLSEWALRNLPSVQGSVSRQSLQHEGPSSSPEFDTDLERGSSVNWDPNSDLSSLAALPFVNIDLPTGFDLDFQNSNPYTVPSSLGALPFANFDLQKDFGLDHQNCEESAMPSSSDVGLDHDKDFLAGCEHTSKSSQPGMASTSTPAPCPSTTIPPTDLPLSLPSTNAVPPVSQSSSQVPPDNAHVPLPPAPSFRCSACPRKFSSRLRLE